MEVGAAVGLGEHVGAVGVVAADGDEAAADHAVELARQARQQLERLAVDRPRAPRIAFE